MNRPLAVFIGRMLAIVAFAAVASAQNPVAAGTADPAELQRRLDQLIEQNGKLVDQNQALMDQINALRQAIAASAQPTSTTRPAPIPLPVPTPTPEAVPVQVKNWGTYTPNLGFKVANTEYGDMNISIYTYARYLNQRNLNPTYTDAFGNTKTLHLRQDFQLNKVQMKFLGWVMSEKFRYFLYVWTNNAVQGLGAQVVVAGNVNYTFNKYITLSAGITGLPGTRSIEGNFPFWMGVDSRHIADEFFRPSYTSGVWARGNFTDRLSYQAMIGNNLSTLGVSASQLDNKFNTFTGALVWNPTGADFGPGFGDFEHHDTVSTRLATHFTRSDESKQSQPGEDDFENTQLRLSDGSVIFTPNLFGQGITISDARYQMTNVDGGLKYRGFSLDGTYYWRWLGKFQGSNTGGVPSLFDQGFEAQVSTMLMPKTLQFYGGFSKILGQYGNPWDARAGISFFPWKNKVVRWNNEALYLHNSPVGYTAVPFTVGGLGFVFHSTIELAF